MSRNQFTEKRGGDVDRSGYEILRALHEPNLTQSDELTNELIVEKYLAPVLERGGANHFDNSARMAASAILSAWKGAFTSSGQDSSTFDANKLSDDELRTIVRITKKASSRSVNAETEAAQGDGVQRTS